MCRTWWGGQTCRSRCGGRYYYPARRWRYMTVLVLMLIMFAMLGMGFVARLRIGLLVAADGQHGAERKYGECFQ